MLRDSDNPERGDARPLAQRLGWMAVIWLISVGLLGIVAYAIRWWINS